MRHAICLLLVGIACALPSASRAQGWTGNVNAFVGTRFLDEDDLEPVDEQDQLGVLIDFRPTPWPINLAIDLLRSEADESASDPFSGATAKLDMEITEVHLGVRKLWDRTPSLRPYVGGGLAYTTADISASVSIPPFITISGSDDDSGIGLWAGGGLYWTLGNAFNIGLDLRYSHTEVSFGDLDLNVGGTHAGVLLGYHW